MNEMVIFYQENGYLQLPHFFTGEEISVLRAALDKVVATKRPRVLGEDREHKGDFTYVLMLRSHDEKEQGLRSCK